MRNFQPNLVRIGIILFACIACVFISNYIYSQTDPCLPQHDSPVHCSDPLNEGNSEYHIRIYVHVIERSDGSGGQSLQDVGVALEKLYEAFSPHGIYFEWDCNIDDIEDTDLYEGNTARCNVLDDHSNDDGIHVYFFPDGPVTDPAGGGRTENIGVGATSFYVYGRSNYHPYGSLVKSHVTSHEMGHCLGLWHPHEQNENDAENVLRCDEDEGVDYSCNCEDAGDCLCDTNASPNLKSTVSPHPNCDYDDDPNRTGPEGEPYVDPPVANYMSLSPHKCRMEFTDGQGERMRNAIATVPELQDCIVDVSSKEITSDETWDLNSHPSGKVFIESNLVVKSGATLTIKSGITVMFGKESNLIIEPNAEVVLYGKLTNLNCDELCTETGYCGDTWKGVEVWGVQCTTAYEEEDCGSQFIVNGERAVGKFVGEPGSVVENAETAVQLWGPNKSFSGGIIYCNGTDFVNNRIGVHFYKFHNFYPHDFPPSKTNQPRDYKGRFYECDFLNNSQYPHEEDFISFVNMFKVDGPAFYGCSFRNVSYTPGSFTDLSTYGYGISAYDSEFRVVGSCTSNPVPNPCPDYNRTLFEGLGYGINAGVFHEIDPFTVTRADFKKCFVGIHNRSMTGATMLFNKFYLGNLPTIELNSDQIGIALRESIDGFTIEENDFIGVPEDEFRTIGISSYGIGYFNNVIRRNEFEGLNVGNEAGGQCGDKSTGLRYICNFNANNIDHDFLVCDNPDVPFEGIKKGQFAAGVETRLATGNQFSNTGSPPDRDFSNNPPLNNPEGISINYYYKTGAGPIEKPDEYSGFDNSIPVTENTCPQQYCNPPCRTPSELSQIKQEFYTERADFQSDYAAYENAMNSGDTSVANQYHRQAVTHRQIMDKKAYTVLVHAMYDTVTYSRDSVRTWLKNMNYFSTDMRRAMDYLGEGEEQTAQTILDSASTRFELTASQQEDLNNMYELVEMLGDTSVEALSDEDLNQLDTIAIENRTISSGIAKNILTLHGRHYPPVQCGHSGPPKLKEDDRETESIKLNVYPNPAGDQVTFERNDHIKKEAGVLITDLTGRVVQEIDIGKGDRKARWNATEQIEGIYFYQLRRDGQPVDYGRIIIQ